MGKIRVKTIGDETTEEAEKQKADVKREQKKVREDAEEVVSDQPEQPQPTQSPSEPAASSQQPVAAKRKKQKFAKQKSRSSKYKTAVMEIDKNKTYSLPEALELLRKIKLAKFDETVELHINTIEAGISGQVKLPHGTGKEIRIAIATDELIEQIEKGLPATPSQASPLAKPARQSPDGSSRMADGQSEATRASGLRGGRGKLDFDILIAEPSMMAKLAKVAKVLGPKGLMPNPKNGTISDNPQEAMKKFQGGQISFKTESKIPIMHLSVGKTSFEDNQLSENIKTMIAAIKRDRITQVILKSTMSPGIKLAI